MATDRVSAALLLAQREARDGRLSTEAARQLLAAIAGDEAVPEVHAPRPRDSALDSRDEAVRRLSDLAPSRSTWAAAGRVADWLARWHAGDPLRDAPAGAGELCAAVRPILRRQIFRILSGDRSG